MASAKWHYFEAGTAYDKTEVVRVLEKHLDSGKVKKTVWKVRTQLERIRAGTHRRIVFSPTTGWGASPMNGNAWKTMSGDPIS